MPPNGQGLTALIALNILEGYDIKAMGHNSPQALHTMIETMRLAFADTQQYVADPEMEKIPTQVCASEAGFDILATMTDQRAAVNLNARDFSGALK
eukprot:SAG31_NODE_7697_length_1614_cov_1.347855_2_plen_96_part_00